MDKQKEEIYTNVSVEEMLKKLQEKKNEILEAFAKAYLAETGLLPSQVELCCQQLPMVDNKIEHVYFFRRRNEETKDGNQGDKK